MHGQTTLKVTLLIFAVPLGFPENFLGFVLVYPSDIVHPLVVPLQQLQLSVIFVCSEGILLNFVRCYFSTILEGIITNYLRFSCFVCVSYFPLSFVFLIFYLSVVGHLVC
jgi:hypothetical protein